MREVPLPEEIRGSWFLLSVQGTPREALSGKSDLLRFCLDGSFQRWRIQAHALKQVDEGDYTFDGSFLILRGRRTTTYRVSAEAPVRWIVEDKKGRARLMRAVADPDRERTLPPEELTSLSAVPSRARCLPLAEDPGSPLVEVRYKGKLLATIAGERVGDELWAAVTTCVDNLPAPTWGRVVRASFVGSNQSSDGEFDAVRAWLVREDLRMRC